jgi:hypothetical protein
MLLPAPLPFETQTEDSPDRRARIMALETPLGVHADVTPTGMVRRASGQSALSPSGKRVT